MENCDVQDSKLSKENGALDLSQGSQGHRSRFRRNASRLKNHKNSALFNIAISLALFFALIQVFDPTLQRRIERDIGHSSEVRSPMARSLEEFSLGKNSNLRQNASFVSLHSKPAHEINHFGHDRITVLLEDAGILRQLSDAEFREVPKWDQVYTSKSPSYLFAINKN
jgi:hypothetical protein